MDEAPERSTEELMELARLTEIDDRQSVLNDLVQMVIKETNEQEKEDEAWRKKHPSRVVVRKDEEDPWKPGASDGDDND
jgi:hypothetical protein